MAAALAISAHFCAPRNCAKCVIKLSPQKWARLETKLRKGPLAHGFANDQRWTLGRIKTLIGKLFHVGYTVEGIWKLIRQHGWSPQVPVRQALERDDEAVAVWKAKVWPEIKGRRATWAPRLPVLQRRGRASLLLGTSRAPLTGNGACAPAPSGSRRRTLDPTAAGD
jgi:hypothetical protein